MTPIEPTGGACGAVAVLCVCDLDQHGPETPHECHKDSCGAAWLGKYGDATFEPIRWPGAWRLGVEHT